MRGLSKPWPPANVSPDGQAPRRFVDAEEEYLAELDTVADKTVFARSQFDRLDKVKLRAVLYAEQRFLCVFCERSVGEGYPAPRIDHWQPLSVHHIHALHWRNLYLSCTTSRTCDDEKGDRPLKSEEDEFDLPWPTDLAYEDLVGFTSFGEIYVRADRNIEEAVRRTLALAIEKQPHGAGYSAAILNLNHPALVAARAAAIDSERNRIEKRFPGRTASREEREHDARALLEENPFRAFVSVRVAWLRRALGKGREQH